MEGEIYRFRKRIFGGFNRDDVVRYIAAIAQEKNESIASVQRAGEEIQKLREELAQRNEVITAYERIIKKLRDMKAEPDNSERTPVPEPEPIQAPQISAQSHPPLPVQNTQVSQPEPAPIPAPIPAQEPKPRSVITIKRKKTEKWSQKNGI